MACFGMARKIALICVAHLCTLFNTMGTCRYTIIHVAFLVTTWGVACHRAFSRETFLFADVVIIVAGGSALAAITFLRTLFASITGE